MRIRDCRRLFIGLPAGFAFAFGGTALAQTLQVETFTASGVAICTMPGTASAGGLTFATNATLQSVDFTPGATFFNGAAVDFDGSEATFIASTYGAGVHTPVAQGPAVTLVTGTGTVGGGAGGSHGGGCRVTGGNVPLGPMFSSSRLDLATGPGVNLTATILSWDSAALPQLSGHAVTADGPLNITSVDAINGIVNFTMSGKIYAGSQAVPALTTLGFICLATGLFGMAVLAVSRRSSQGGGPIR